MSVQSGQNFAYWIVPVNLTGLPGLKSTPRSAQMPLDNITWEPDQVQAPSTDALFPNGWTFDLSQLYEPNADGTTTAALTVTGKTEQQIRIKIKTLVHGGVLGARVDSVSGNTFISAETIDSAGTDNWTGRYVICIGRFNGSGPYVSYYVTAFVPATGEFTCSEAVTMEAGDAFVVCMQQDGGSNATNPLLLTDSKLEDAESEHGGLNPAQELGCQVRVIHGMSLGQIRKVTAATATSWAVDSALPVDATSVWIIEGANWLDSEDSNDTASAAAVVTKITIPTVNYLDGSLLVMGVTINSDGTESDQVNAPIRMVYLYGSAYVQVFVTASTYSMTVTDQVVTLQGTNQTVILPPSAMIRRFPRYIVHKGVGTATIQPTGDTIEGKESVTMQPGDRITIMPSS